MEICFERIIIESFDFLNKNAIKLKLNFCELEEIPNLDEYSFKEIDLSYNELKKLPKFPKDIEVLKVSFNRLIGTINLTEYTKLKELRINDNRLQIFPKLPNGIKYIDSRFNFFKEIKNIPDSIEKIMLSYNYNLIDFNLPKSIKKVWTHCCPKLKKEYPFGVWVNNKRSLQKPENTIKRPCNNKECLISFDELIAGSEYLMCETCKMEYLYSEIVLWLSECESCPHCRQLWDFKDFLYINYE
jgi:hypothetical protein